MFMRKKLNFSAIRSLSVVLPITGTPVLATLVSGIFAALASLILNLEILVEMMSIGKYIIIILTSSTSFVLRLK